MLARVLLSIDDAQLRGELRGLLTRSDTIVGTVARRQRLLARVARESTDLIVVSRSLVPEPAAESIRLLRKLPDWPAVVVVSAGDDPDEQASLLAAGCDAVLRAGLPAQRIAEVLATVLAKRQDVIQKGIPIRRAQVSPRLTDFVSSSPAMQRFMNVVRRVVSTDVSLLILGETGVGKERLVRAIHAESSRAAGPFIAVNCGALPESLLESELFGHEEGAFTGATRSRRGWFELAHGGTIFLDEIGDMPHHLQVKLLRVLQEHEIQRVGSEEAIQVDVRVTAATNRDLEEEVEAHRFRRDLYYRLSVVTLSIPPLRERREDIPALVESYIDYLRPRIGRNVDGITPEAIEALTRYPWPGNVRELINVTERAMLLCNGEQIELHDLPEGISGTPRTPRVPLLSEPAAQEGDGMPDAWLSKPLAEVRGEMLSRFERVYLEGLLRATRGRIGETAKRAGIRARSLYDKMKAHGLRKEDFRDRPADR